MRRLILGTAVVVVFALTLASLALAGTGYEGQAGGVQGQVQSQGVESAGAGGGALPFTGQDLTIFLAAGIALILAGSGFYRLNRRRS